MGRHLSLGYNKTIDSNLIGGELGGTWQSGKSDGLDENGYFNAGCPSGCPDGTLGSEVKIHTYETLSARAGHIFDDTTLLYVTAGVALGQVTGTLTQNPTNVALGWFNNGSNLTDHDTPLGYALGGGIEHKLNEKWSIKANYEYVNFGNVSFKYHGPLNVPPTTSAYLNQSNSIFFSNLSLGISYKF